MIRIFILLIFLSTHLCAQNLLETGLGTLQLAGATRVDETIRIAGTGNLHTNKAFFPSETTLEEIDIRVQIMLQTKAGAGNFRFGIGKYSGIAGTLVEFVITNTSSTLHMSRLNGLTAVSPASQHPLPFNLVEGHTYNIRLSKRIQNMEVEITSVNTGEHYETNVAVYPSLGCLWGTPFIGGHTGTILLKEFSLTTPFSITPRLVVWGDSFIEGNSLSSMDDRYISLIKDSIQYENIAITGRGGESTTSLATRFPVESKWFNGSKYALLAVGVNEANFATWKTNTEHYMQQLKQKNITPILVTLTPRADRLPFISQVNQWIRTSYTGLFVDLAKAVSIDNNWISGMSLADNIHPSPAGHQAIFDRFKVEAAYLFHQYDLFTINYATETTAEILGDAREYAYNVKFSSVVAGANSTVPLIPGQTLYIRDTTDILGMSPIYFILPVPHRPAAPIKISMDMGAYDWNYVNEFSEISAYEYSTDEGNSWSTCTEKPIYQPSALAMDVRVKATTSNFSGNILSFYSSQVASANEDIFEQVMIYPNPVKDKLVITKLNEETLLKLYTSDGQLIKTERLSQGDAAIETEYLSEGIYVLLLSNQTKSRSYKIVKL